VLFGDLVGTSRAVASTPGRLAKIAAIAALLVRLAPEEVEPAVSFLAGQPRQGKVGVGWAALYGTTATPGMASRATEAPLHILDVDAAITELGGLVGTGSAGARQRRLSALFERATEEESEFIRRLLTGELRQGALVGVVTDAVARAARVAPAALRRAAMLAGDLAAVAPLALAGGEPALASVGLQVLRPVLPMLAAPAPDVASAVRELGRSSVEWKLDGARIQAHRAGDEVRLYTRNLNDVSARLPGVAAVVASLPAESVILDGEVLGLGSDERPDRFQDTMSAFGRRDGGGGGLTTVFFDLLHLDGVDLLDVPLSERITALERVAGRWRVPGILTADADEAAAFLDASLAAGHEGVVVKSADSTYEAGRRGGAWRKVKPVRTLDLVVLAAEWGHGRRQGWLSNLHLGARHPDGGFVMVGKTFKGLTDAMLSAQTERLQQLRVGDHGHVVEVRPELVVEVALDGVQVSTRYPGGVALRFARVRRYRDDKSADEADTIEAVRSLLT